MKTNIKLNVAGGGKTTQIVDFVKNRSKVLVISFTNTICDEFKNKYNITATTLHSLCSFLLDTKYTLFESSLPLIKHCLKKRKYNKIRKKHITEIEHFVNTYYICHEYAEIKEDMSCYEFNKEVKQLIEDINEIKNKNNIYFFSDLIRETDKNIDYYYEKIDNLYDHICIDEAQDLSYSQYQLVAKIIKNVFVPKGDILIVGDVNQSIYDFQGSSPTYYLSFLQYIESISYECTVENNNKTYRFGGEILQLINKKYNLHLSDIKEGKVYQYTVTDQIVDIVTKIINNINKLNILVLFDRNNIYVQKIQQKLNQGSNYKLYNSVIFDAIKAIASYLQNKNSYAQEVLNQALNYKNLDNFLFLLETGSYTQIIEYCLHNFYNCSKSLAEAIYKIHFNYANIFDFCANFPNYIHIKENGIQYFTVHSAKGLESEYI